MATEAGPIVGDTRTRTEVASSHAENRTAVVSSLVSDAHTWNLVFLQLLLEESGFSVTNLGPCVPAQELVDTCRRGCPDVVVVSSVNGHGFQDGLEVVAELRSQPELEHTLIVIDGKLGVSEEGRARRAGRLVAAGYDAVYEGVHDTAGFRRLLQARTAHRP